MKSGIQSFAVLFGLFSGLDSVAALPQASVTLFEFVSVGPVIGTQFAEPLGTASDGSVTTFLLENIMTTSTSILVGSSTEAVTATLTGIETVMVSASGWAQSNFPTSTAADSTQLGGGVDCFFTASASGECVQEEVLDDGSTSTRTLTGAVTTDVFAISTGTLPSTAPTTVSQSTVSTLSTSVQQSTVTALSTTPSSTTSAPTSATSNAATSRMMHSGGKWSMVAVAAVGGMMIGASTLLF